MSGIEGRLLGRKAEDIVHMFRYEKDYFWTRMTGFTIKEETKTDRSMTYKLAVGTGRKATLYAFPHEIHGKYYACDIEERSLPFGLSMYYMKPNKDIFTKEAIPFVAITKEKPDDFGGVFIIENGHGYECFIFGNGDGKETEFTDGSMCNFVFE
jgi:hypothetical protein